MDANKVIHVARGLCWHEWSPKETIRPRIGRQDCLCGVWTYTGEYQTDYTDPVHYCALMVWMRGGDRITDLEKWACCGGSDAIFIDFENWMHLPRQEQVSLIAEAIEAGVLK